MICVVCHKFYIQGYSHTCSEACHEAWLEQLKRECGNYQKIVQTRTGEAFKVPLRDIYEKGIKEKDLNRYPHWQEGDSKFDKKDQTGHV